MWAMTGIAVRMGLMQRLHTTTSDDDDPAELIEHRRRLWCYILSVDVTAGVRAGFRFTPETPMFELTVPASIDGDDFRPDMTGKDVSRDTGATNTLFIIFRYETTKALVTFGRAIGIDHQQALAKKTTFLRNLETQIKELEDTLGLRCFQFCDPSVPLHVLTSILARGSIRKMRQVLEHTKLSLGNTNEDDRNVAFAENIKILEYANLLQSTPTIQRFMWFVDYNYSWGALVQLLHELSGRLKEDETSEKAWKLFEEWFGYRLAAEEKGNANSSWFDVMCDMALKAWGTRRARLDATGNGQQETPKFIVKLQERWQTLHRVAATESSTHAASAGVSDRNMAQSPRLNNFDWDASYVPDFGDWDTTLRNFEMAF